MFRTAFYGIQKNRLRENGTISLKKIQGTIFPNTPLVKNPVNEHYRKIVIHGYNSVEQ